MLHSPQKKFINMKKRRAPALRFRVIPAYFHSGTALNNSSLLRSNSSISSSSSGRFDHIFYRNAIVKSFKIVSKGKYDVPYISDHYPVLSDFDVSVFLINGKGKVGITFVKK